MASDDKVNILLVDDHAIVRSGLRLLLEREPESYAPAARRLLARLA